MTQVSKHLTWGGRFTETPDESMVRFGESVSFDARLLPYDIQGSKAHAAMLAHVGLITSEEFQAIQKGLDDVKSEFESGSIPWDMNLEDVHMNVEQALTRHVPAAAKLHTARSRNDQIATDMRLFFKEACAQLAQLTIQACEAFVDLAEANKDILVPGYTHLQRAQPVSVAHHLLAYVEMLGRDCERYQEVLEHANVCPLGSGAIAGTTLPIDRAYAARLLGFTDANGEPKLTQNSMDAVADRDLYIEFVQACALGASHMSRIAEDWILWNTAEFGFLNLPDAFTTGSSLMPQKKNPDSLELIRGKSARVSSHVQALYQMVKGLPLTYNRDLQEDKPPVFDAFDQCCHCLVVLRGTTMGTTFNRARCEEAVSDPALLATDLVDYLVMRGVAFRDAHHVIGSLVAMAEKRDCKLNELSYEEVVKVHPAFGEDWIHVFNLDISARAREKIGMPGPKQIDAQIQRWRQSFANHPMAAT